MLTFRSIRTTRRALPTAQAMYKFRRRLALILFPNRPAGDERADFLAADGAEDVAVFAEVEDENWHVVFHAVGDGRAIHYAEVPFADGGIIELAVEDGVRVPLGVVAIDAIDARGLEQDVGVKLHR